MSYIPPVREKTLKNIYTGAEKGPNPYWEGNLNEQNKSLLQVMDWTIEDALSFFDNADNYAEEIVEKTDVIIPTKVFRKLVEGFKEAFEDYIEMQRTQTVVSWIESQSTEEEEKE